MKIITGMRIRIKLKNEKVMKNKNLNKVNNYEQEQEIQYRVIFIYQLKQAHVVRILAVQILKILYNHDFIAEIPSSDCDAPDYDGGLTILV